MKQTLKVIVFIILTMNAYCLTAQAALGFSAALDNHLTLDVSTKLSMQGYQKQIGFLQVSAKYRFVDWDEEKFQRYGAEVGYAFTYNKFALMPTVGYGIIQRQNDYARRSWEFGTTLSYKLLKNLKAITSIVWTERTDLPDTGYRVNFNTGLQFDISTNYLNL